MSMFLAASDSVRDTYFTVVITTNSIKQTRSVLMTFFLMMVVNPAVQERAQAQIDAVVGKDRLPTIEDRPLLLLIDGILRETLRYNPVTPLCE